MFLTIVKNYLKSKIEFKRTVRIKHQFEIEGYYIYIDLFCSYGGKYRYNSGDIKSTKWNRDDAISYYKGIMVFNDFGKGDNSLFKYLNRLKDKNDLKVVKDYFECVMSRIGSGVNTYINEMEVRTISDIRNDKLNKLLSYNR